MRADKNCFFYGAASAAYQVEGAYNEDGKGPGIWDVLSEGHIAHWENGNVSADFYHHYKEDVALMKEIGLKAFRFSVSWPRIMPSEGKINEKGVQFYRDLADELLSAGITPMCTIYHWNLPMWVHEKGGWLWDGISDLFAEYTKIVVDALSDKVSYWMTLNEPACFTAVGYLVGGHAPFENCMGDEKELHRREYVLTRNVLLAHGKAVRAIREAAVRPPVIGIAVNGTVIEPLPENSDAAGQGSLTDADIDQARQQTFGSPEPMFDYGWWLDPIVLGKNSGLRDPFLSEEELSVTQADIDFIGFNCYNSGNYEERYGKNPNIRPGMPRTAMEWPITPDALYWTIRFLNERYDMPLMVTENGMACYDFVMRDGKVHDPQRIDFMAGYLEGVERARSEGYPVFGYLYWSILDNLEWSNGYDKRFGLIYVDYATGKRTVKDSALWYRDYIKEHS